MPRSSGRDDINRRFLEIARDPRILAGVHHACDEWCEPCPLKDRCLRFRCTTEFRRLHRRRPADPAFRTALEALEFARALAAVDEHPRRGPSMRGIAPSGAVKPDDQAVVDIALEYATRSRQFVPSASAGAAAKILSASEVVLRFHSRIYFKTTRAIVGYQLTSIGMADRGADACRTAAQALACIDRSRTALAQLADTDERHALIDLLDTIARGLDVRFPDARALRRADVHAA